MPLFGKKSSAAAADEPVVFQPSHNPKNGTKQRSADVHDPILTAVHEAQPFEVNNQANTISLSPNGAHRDVFGNVINNPDRSNPARPRDERPLDTIRSFEYACSGDDRIRNEMETPRLGWQVRNGFQSMPHFDGNPYARGGSADENFDSKAPINTHIRPLPVSNSADKSDEGKKKKRNLFGRKKK